jgi:hypothetical protein
LHPPKAQGKHDIPQSTRSKLILNIRLRVPKYTSSSQLMPRLGISEPGKNAVSVNLTNARDVVRLQSHKREKSTRVTVSSVKGFLERERSARN